MYTAKDFLGNLQSRLAVLCVFLNTLEHSMAVNGYPVYVSSDECCADAKVLVCDELSRILGNIDAFLANLDDDEIGNADD